MRTAEEFIKDMFKKEEYSDVINNCSYSLQNLLSAESSNIRFINLYKDRKGNTTITDDVKESEFLNCANCSLFNSPEFKLMVNKNSKVYFIADYINKYIDNSITHLKYDMDKMFVCDVFSNRYALVDNSSTTHIHYSILSLTNVPIVLHCDLNNTNQTSISVEVFMFDDKIFFILGFAKPDKSKYSCDNLIYNNYINSIDQTIIDTTSTVLLKSKTKRNTMVTRIEEYYNNQKYAFDSRGSSQPLYNEMKKDFYLYLTELAEGDVNWVSIKDVLNSNLGTNEKIRTNLSRDIWKCTEISTFVKDISVVIEGDELAYFFMISASTNQTIILNFINNHKDALKYMGYLYYKMEIDNEDELINSEELKLVKASLVKKKGNGCFIKFSMLKK